MRAKIVLTLEEAKKALLEDDFDFAVILHEIVSEAPDDQYYRREPHATLWAGKYEYELTKKIARDDISSSFFAIFYDSFHGFTSFGLKDFQTLAIMGWPRFSGKSFLEELFPEIEIVGQGQYQYGENGKLHII